MFTRRGVTRGFKLFQTLTDSSQKRTITFTKGTEQLEHTTDPTIRRNIDAINRADKRDKRETIVIQHGTVSHYDRDKRHVYLPQGHKDPVSASHELQHANDYVNLDALPPQNVLEKRAFTAQQKTAQHLGLDDQLNGKTPEQRSESHSQVKRSNSNSTSGFASWMWPWK